MRWHSQLGTVTDIAQAALQVAADPALGPFVDRLKTLHELEVEAEANSPPTTPGPPVVGVGLQNFLLPLDIYIFFKQRPWAFLGIVGGAVFGVGLVGYRVARKRCRAA